MPQPEDNATLVTLLDKHRVGGRGDTNPERRGHIPALIALALAAVAGLSLIGLLVAGGHRVTQLADHTGSFNGELTYTVQSLTATGYRIHSMTGSGPTTVDTIVPFATLPTNIQLGDQVTCRTHIDHTNPQPTYTLTHCRH